MGKIHGRSIIVLLILVAMLYLQCDNGGSKLPDHGTGLIFATREELRGIPFAELPQGAGQLPARFDLSTDMPAVGNQGMQNSCVGWATAYALKAYQEKQDLKQSLQFSPAFIYNQINSGRDGGSKFIDALNILSQEGAALWRDMPYSETDYLTQPTADIKLKARPYGIIAWQQVNVRDYKEVKMQVGAGNPVVFAIMTDEGFKRAEKNSQGEYIWISKTGNDVGGHAMIVVGYDDSKNAFKVMNSWGSGWGNNGYCWIDYKFFQQSAMEGYIAKDGKTNNAPDNTDTTTTIPTTTTTTTTIDTSVIDPTYDPKKFRKADFYNIQVVHNQSDPTWGNGMKITGVANIPQGLGRTFQISIHFYFSNSVLQVGSLQSPTFADVNGFAATGTILYNIPDDGLNNWPFEVFMPYSAFNIQVGNYNANNVYQYKRTYLYAIPTLFIDNFGYAKGKQIDFYVDR